MRVEDFRDRAREALKGRWLLMAMIMLLATLLGASVQGADNLMNTVMDLLGNSYSIPTGIRTLMSILDLALVIFAGAGRFARSGRGVRHG